MQKASILNTMLRCEYSSCLQYQPTLSGYHRLCSLQSTADISFWVHRHDVAFAIQLSHSLKETFHIWLAVCIREVFKSLLARSVS